MHADAYAVSLAALLDDPGEPIGDQELQRVLGAAVRRYAARRVSGEGDPIAPYLPDAGVTATDALVTAGELLRAAEVSSFELANMFNL